MENGKRPVGILKHSILINAPSQINAPGPQTFLREFRSCFNKHPLFINIFHFLGGREGCLLEQPRNSEKAFEVPGAFIKIDSFKIPTRHCPFSILGGGGGGRAL